MRTPYPYAIFDMDGTLLDSMPYWATIGSDYLRDHGVDAKPAEMRALEGMSMPEAAAYFHDQFGVPGTPESILQGINDKMRGNYLYTIPAKPGVVSYLEQLDQSGVSMALCSATSPELILAVLDRLNLRRFFSVIVSCDEVSAGKDRPDAYQLALDRLGARPEECVIYEDAFFAMKTAKSMGCRVIGVYDASCKKTPEEVEAFCDGYIKDYQTAVMPCDNDMPNDKLFI